MGGATRFMSLLTTPFPPLRPSLHILRRLSTTPLRRSHLKNTHSPRQVVSCFHSQRNNSITNNEATTSHSYHPWPEWTNFLNFLSNSPTDTSILPEDAFVVYERLPDDFVRASASCLAFARARPGLIRSLSRKDIEAVVTTGTPFLFRGPIDIARRMGAFLNSHGSEVVDVSTVDLMKYILSYASNPNVSSKGNGLYNRELVDSSVRNLLCELVMVSSGAPAATDNQFSGRPRQTSGPLGQNIEMKRGDWRCTKCTFMNFARNVHCRECNEQRPRKQLTGGEWECPQCNFCNYGANSACLRCDCRRAGAPLFPTMHSGSGTGDNGDLPYTSSESQDLQSSSGTDKDKELLAAKTKNWFQKIAELHDGKDLPSAVTDEDFPEIMPMRKGENKFVVTKKKERSLTSPKYKRQAAIDQTNDTNFVPFVPFPPGYFAKKDEQSSLPNSSVEEEPTGVDVSSKDSKPISPLDTRTGRNDYQPTISANSRVQTSSTSDIQIDTGSPRSHGLDASSKDYNPVSPVDTSTGRRNDYQPTISANSHVQMSSTFHNIQSGIDIPRSNEKESTYNNSVGSSPQLPENESFRSNWVGPSLEGSAVKEADPLDMSEEAKTERWFKRVAQIKDISELNQIPDEDFPSIMPMRKGVNRFVVSKRKSPIERRLTNQQYRRNLPIVSTDPVNSKEGDSR